MVKLEVVVSGSGRLPEYATQGAAGLDLRAAEDVTIAPMERKLISTGLQIAVPPGYEAQVRPRSGLALKHGLTLVNTPGTIDSDYRGEVGLIMINLGEDVVQIRMGERIAQMVICPLVRVDVCEVTELTTTERGEGGFGSTGSA